MADRMVAFISTATQSPDGDSNTTLNFDWAFRPITTWMKIFGIPFHLMGPPPSDGNNSHHQGDDSSSRNKIKKNRWSLSIVLTVAFYLFDIGCNTYVIIEDVSDVKKKNYTATINWNWMINEVNYYFLTVPTHTALVFATLSGWKGLAQIFHRLENEYPFINEHYKKFRRVCVVGSCIMFIEIIIEFTESLKYAMTIKENVPFIKNLLINLKMVAFVFPFLGAILFCCIGWIACVMLRILAGDIIEATTASATLPKSNKDWAPSFCSWRRRYLLIIQLVHEMSRYFGFVLLIIIASEFVRMTGTSFFLLVDYQSKNWKASTILMTFDFCKEAICFFIVVYIPSRIQQEASDLIKQLRKMNFKDHALQNQINFLTAEMIHSIPSVTAMGLVQVNLQLIPSLIGTTLTYLIIFCQFQTSEKANNS